MESRKWAADAAATPPPQPVSPSTGYPTDGNPLTGTPATEPGAYLWYALTEEVRNAIIEGGLTPDIGVLTQLRDSMRKISSRVGEISVITSTTAPANAIKANGALLSRTAYADLWAHAQASGLVEANDAAWLANKAANGTNGMYSPGDGSTTFRIPDPRGDFIRLASDGNTVDSGRGLASFQIDQFKSHRHRFVNEYNTPTELIIGFTLENSEGLEAQTVSGNRAHSYISMEYTGGSETRPRNTAYLAVLYYK